MDINISGTPNEIAALVAAIQERQGEYVPIDIISQSLSQAIRDTVAKEQAS